MKWILLLVLALSILAAGHVVAGSNTEGFGLGLMAGEPSGLAWKAWTGKRTAFDGGLAWSMKDDGQATAYVDYLWHVHDMRRSDHGIMPFYYGVGVRYLGRQGQDDSFGVRIPLGLNYLFADSAFDLFLELAPIIDFLPEQEFSANAVIGGRYFF